MTSSRKAAVAALAFSARGLGPVEQGESPFKDAGDSTSDSECPSDSDDDYDQQMLDWLGPMKTLVA
jgi:hypothetical protein